MKGTLQLTGGKKKKQTVDIAKYASSQVDQPVEIDLSELKRIPGIEPFLIPDLLPDLLYMVSLPNGKDLIVDAIKKTDPSKPKELIFNHQLQDPNRRLMAMEKMILQDVHETVEHEFIRCSKCGGKRLDVHRKQTRSLDEPETVFYSCINKNCMHKWRESAA